MNIDDLAVILDDIQKEMSLLKKKLTKQPNNNNLSDESIKNELIRISSQLNEITLNLSLLKNSITQNQINSKLIDIKQELGRLRINSTNHYHFLLFPDPIWLKNTLIGVKKNVVLIIYSILLVCCFFVIYYYWHAYNIIKPNSDRYRVLRFYYQDDKDKDDIIKNTDSLLSIDSTKNLLIKNIEKWEDRESEKKRLRQLSAQKEIEKKQADEQLQKLDNEN